MTNGCDFTFIRTNSRKVFLDTTKEVIVSTIKPFAW